MRKLDKLLEPRPSDDEGNQQPSLAVMQGRFNDYAEYTGSSRNAHEDPAPTSLGDDIV